MRVGSGQGGGCLQRGAVEDATRGRRPGIRDPPRDDDRTDDPVLRREGRRQGVAQAVGPTDPRCDPVRDRLLRRELSGGSGRTRRVFIGAASPDEGREVRPDSVAAIAQRVAPMGAQVVAGGHADTAGRHGQRQLSQFSGHPDRDREPLGRRSASGPSGSIRSPMGRIVVESGTPRRVLVSVASRTIASGRRRAITTWSASVAVPNSSTMARTMASAETERDRPDRIRAKDSASPRRPVSRTRTA